MHGPAVVTWLLAALTAASGLYCLTRLRSTATACGPATSRWPAREGDAAEALMGLGMAAMALWPGPAWGWPYGLLGLALLLATAAPGGPARRAHRLHHAVGALAMAYLALTMPTGTAHHHPTPGLPLLTGALLLYFGSYALWTGTHLLTPSGTVTGSTGTTTPAVSRACRLAMGIGMFSMLLTM
ncbi:hypothetical protein CFP65_6653 [Kitasatospora sp. MMS16-BH015]|uniref:DUF5134 domain-containing protein n=1 Tax=Kitasatospora sp. MMS16-BH015 TaxID=2018025 RepID=UPI000CA30C8B|nr:DUF5134 domain-containing protein [Kitasatospora sp. MMS16-BH015]AUG81299.1 hypothetical protein CFP65_6653 [Kitasatospora sp. MMS16-BH015]